MQKKEEEWKSTALTATKADKEYPNKQYSIQSVINEAQSSLRHNNSDNRSNKKSSFICTVYVSGHPAKLTHTHKTPKRQTEINVEKKSIFNYKTFIAMCVAFKSRAR